MLRRSWIPRVLLPAGAATAAVLVAAGAATAATTVPLHDAHRGATAAKFDNHSCEQIPGGAPMIGKDGWVFVLPKNDANFVTLTLQFKTTGGATETITVPNPADAYPDGITTNGTSKAWVVLPIGWTLLDGSATVSKSTDAEFFNLTHTCPGSSTSPSPSTSASPSISPSPSESSSTSPSPSSSRSGSTEATSSGSASSTPSVSTSVGGGGGGSLPVTGVALGGMVLTGGAAIAGGAALLVLRRRRDKVDFSTE